MFTHVFDVEMNRVFFDERIQYNYKAYIESAVVSRQEAYDLYEVVTYHMTIDSTRFDRVIFLSTCVLEILRHDEKWDKYVRSDKLEQLTHSVLKVTPSMCEFYKLRMSKSTNYFY